MSDKPSEWAMMKARDFLGVDPADESWVGKAGPQLVGRLLDSALSDKDAELASLRAEIERLRGALDPIAKMPCPYGSKRDCRPQCVPCRARAALSPQEKAGG